MTDKPRHDHALLIFCVAVFIFNSPLTNWWSALGLPWYAMFIGWAAIIAMIAANQWRGADHGD